MSKYNLQTCLLAGKTDLGHTDILKTFNQNNHSFTIKIKNYILMIFKNIQRIAFIKNVKKTGIFIYS